MSRHSRTIITVSVRFPVPSDMSQKAALEEFKYIVANNASEMAMNEAIIKLEKKETIYLS